MPKVKKGPEFVEVEVLTKFNPGWNVGDRVSFDKNDPRFESLVKSKDIKEVK